MTRYVFIGAGAIGSALGGLLAERGSEVVLVARGQHARAMAENGLRIRCPDTTLTVAAPTVTGPDQVRLGTEDVLVLTTKTQQARAALDQWADQPVHDQAGRVVGSAAELLPILTAANGVASEEIALRTFERVFAVCVWFPVALIEPGEVIVRTAVPRGIFHIGRYGLAADRSLPDGLARDWDAAGFRVIESDAVMRWKYRKLLSNLGNVLQALLGDTTGAEDLRTAAETEAREVLAAAGIAVAEDEESRQVWRDSPITSVPGQPAQLGGSSWQSLVRGTGSIETDYLNGEIALVARGIGRGAPINARLSALARRAVREGLAPGSVDAAGLRRELAL